MSNLGSMVEQRARAGFSSDTSCSPGGLFARRAMAILLIATACSCAVAQGDKGELCSFGDNDIESCWQAYFDDIRFCEGEPSGPERQACFHGAGILLQSCVSDAGGGSGNQACRSRYRCAIARCNATWGGDCEPMDFCSDAGESCRKGALCVLQEGNNNGGNCLNNFRGELVFRLAAEQEVVDPADGTVKLTAEVREELGSVDLEIEVASCDIADVKVVAAINDAKPGIYELEVPVPPEFLANCDNARLFAFGMSPQTGEVVTADSASLPIDWADADVNRDGQVDEADVKVATELVLVGEMTQAELDAVIDAVNAQPE